MRSHLLPLLVAALLATSGAAAPAATPTVPAHCVADKDGQLVPEPGYRWVSDKSGDFRVVWAPGQIHSALYQHTIAGAAPGNWNPAPGYRWVSTANNDLRTEAVPATFVAPASFAPSAVQSTGPSEDQIKRAVGKLIAAAVAHAVTQSGDDSLGDAIIREIARSARDELIKSTLEDLFPNMPAQDRQTAGNLISLALDKQLTAQNLSEREAKDAILAKLRRQNPDMANAAEVADLVYRVMQSQSR